MTLLVLSVLAFLQVDFQDLNLNYYDTRSGLSSNIVYDVYQDHQGFIWVATENGLNRFDAYEFKVFRTAGTDSNRSGSNIIRSVFEDNTQRLWVSTNSGLAKFNRKTETFRHFSIPDSLAGSNKDIQKVIVDTEGMFWFYRNGLWSFNPISEQFAKINIGVDMNDLNYTDDNLIMSNNSGECLIYNIRKAGKKKCDVNFSSASVKIFSSKDSEKIWGNIIEKPVSGVNFKKLPKLPQEIEIIRFLDDSRSNLWMGTREGLFIQNNEEKLQEINFKENSNTFTNNIKSIFEDRNGGVWIGTTGGLFYSDLISNPFKEINGFTSNHIVMALEEGGNGFWINNFGENISYYQNLNSTEPEMINLGGLEKRIWDIEYIDEGKRDLWLATESGLIFYNHFDRKKTKKELSFNPRDPKVIFCITKTGEGTAWIGGYGGVYKLSTRTGQVLKAIEFPEEYIGVLVQDILVQNTELIIATESHGLFTYSDVSGIEQLNIQRRSSFWDIFRSRDNKIWVAGNEGLFKLSESELVRIPEIESVIFSITQDEKGLLWSGSDIGLISFNPDKKEVRTFKEEEGVPVKEFNRRSILFTKNNEIVAGGVGGAVYFKPSSITLNPKAPNVLITSFEKITRDSITSLPLFQQEELSLEWQENTFEINFTALNYTNSLQNKYKYQLIGYDPDIQESQNIRTARYVRVPEGDYTFKVMGSNNDGVWNEIGDSIEITIKPPYWRTLWFRMLVISLILILVWSLYRYRVHQLLEVERVRLRIAGDLHDEIGSGLSGIALTGDVLKKEVDPTSPKGDLLNRITENARGLASSLDAIVWLIDPSKESIHDLVIRCKQTAHELLEGKELVFKDDIAEPFYDKELSSAVKRNIYLIFKESVHNIFKHSRATKVLITFWIHKKELELKIEDNGNGFEEKSISTGNGLKNMQNRAEEIGADYSINSNTKSGTVILLRKKLP